MLAAPGRLSLRGYPSQARATKGESDVHPDRNHAQSGLAEVPARPRSCSAPARADYPQRRARRASSPLAERLFAIDGVGGVFLGGDFITVTKTDGEWPHIKPAVLGAIMEHFMSGMPVLAHAPAADRRRRVLRRGRRRDRRDDQGADRDAGPPGGRQGRRRHHLPRFPRRGRLSQHARLLRRLPVVDRDAEARHREPAPPFRPGSARDPGSLS